MPSSLSRLSPPPFATDGRWTGAAATLALHVLLVLAWQMANRLPPAPPEGADDAMLWLSVPAPANAAAPPVPALVPAPAPAPRPAPAVARTAPQPRSAPASPAAAVAHSVDSAQPAAPSAASMLESARRSAGDIDRALRKESRPLIVAPPDSPTIRMREGMELARSLAPPRLWEAPKVEELVNNTGDGARRTRVITGNGTYCITERSPATSIDMIEKHGRQRLTSCPQHEEPAKKQVWRTARD